MAGFYIGQALPAKIVRVSSTNLFRVAALELGDATQAYRIAELNGIDDFWLTGGVYELKIPQKAPSTGGIPDG